MQWKCPKCETINSGVTCRLCGESRESAAATTLANHIAQQNAKEKGKKKKIIALIAALVIVIGCGAYWGISEYLAAKELSDAYDQAVSYMESGEYVKAATAFKDLGQYEDSEELFTKSKYLNGKKLMDAGEYENAITIFEGLGEYEDALDLKLQCKYGIAEDLYEEGKYKEAASAFMLISHYKDAEERCFKCTYLQAEEQLDGADYMSAVATFSSILDYSDSKERIATCYLLECDQLMNAGNPLAAYNLIESTDELDYVDLSGKLPEVTQKVYEKGVNLAKNESFSDARNHFAKIADVHTGDAKKCLEVTTALADGTGDALTILSDNANLEFCRTVLLTDDYLEDFLGYDLWYSPAYGYSLQCEKGDTKDTWMNGLPISDEVKSEGGSAYIEDGSLHVERMKTESEINIPKYSPLYPSAGMKDYITVFDFGIIDKNTITVFCHSNKTTYTLKRK